MSARRLPSGNEFFHQLLVLNSWLSFPALAIIIACLGVLLDAIATGNVIDDRPTAGPAAELIQKHTKAVSLTSPPQLR